MKTLAMLRARTESPGAVRVEFLSPSAPSVRRGFFSTPMPAASSLPGSVLGNDRALMPNLPVFLGYCQIDRFLVNIHSHEQLARLTHGLPFAG